MQTLYAKKALSFILKKCSPLYVTMRKFYTQKCSPLYTKKRNLYTQTMSKKTYIIKLIHKQYHKKCKKKYLHV